VAHGDLEVALNIVATSSTATILVGIAVQIFPYAISALFLIALEALITRILAILRFTSLSKYGTYRGSQDDEYVTRVTQLVVITSALGIATAYTASDVFWFGYGSYLVVAIGSTILETHTKRYKRLVRLFFSTDPESVECTNAADSVIRLGNIYSIFAMTIMMTFVALALYGSSVWLPATQYQLKDGQTIVGYRLASSGASISVLEDATRNVTSIDTRSIRSQNYCQLGGAQTTFVEFLHLQHGPRESPCP